SMVAVLAGSIGFLGLGSLFAHPDDPKERDRQPRYEGPAWRLDIDGQGDTPGPAFPSQNIQLMSWLPLGEFGNHTSGNSVWGYVSPGKREYAIMGLSGGTGFVDVTNPGNAQIVAVLSGPTSTWRDMKTYGQYAYAISEGGSGIQVFDLSRIDEGIVTHVNTVLTGGTAATHTLAVNEQSGYLYRAGGGSNGIRIYSLADPANPVLVNQYTERYTHEATVVTYTEGPYAGREIAFLCGGFNGGWNQTGLTILDVTDKQNLQVLAHLQYSDNNYSHQGWPSADMRYFYLNDELDEQNVGFTTRTRIIDISNLNNPTEAGWFTNGLRAVDHNLYVLGNLIFESNYRSGLRVFDNSADPLNPVEIAYFDTYPDNDNPNFNGLWNNYPFLPSGTILGSDIERGLFVWRLVLPLLAFDYPDGRPDLVDPHGGTRMLVQVSADRETPQPGTGVLHVSVNGGDFVEFPMTHLGNHLYEATFPEAPCGSTVRYYVSAETTRGTRFTNPIGAPADAFSAVAAVGFATLFSDPFQTDQGWTVQNVQ
ncbi:MAG: choice-of-anchor B family protein, partial [Phycisphaerales bacterium]|nr:choice-of-anchor B family protein [Phycisphaerales bacterium]